MKCARSLVLLSSLGLALTSSAATEFEDGLVPIELAQEFIGGQLYSSLPDGFPVPEMPHDSGLRILGSLDRGQLNQQVVLHNSGTWESARDTLRTAYQATGWLDIGPEDSPSTIIGAAANALSLCHDELGFLDFLPTAEDRIRVNRNSLPPATRIGALDCAQLKELGQGQSGAIGFGFAMELMPVLELPEGALSGGFPGMAFAGVSRASIGGNGLNFRIDRDGTVVVPNSSVSMLYQHFSAQLETQGWARDSGALGAVSSSSIWLKTTQTPEAPGSTVVDLDLTGIMSILHVEDEQYDVLFRLISHGDGSLLPPSALGPPLNAPELGIRGIPVFNQHGFISGGPIVLP